MRARRILSLTVRECAALAGGCAVMACRIDLPLVERCFPALSPRRWEIGGGSKDGPPPKPFDLGSATGAVATPTFVSLSVVCCKWSGKGVSRRPRRVSIHFSPLFFFFFFFLWVREAALPPTTRQVREGMWSPGPCG